MSPPKRRLRAAKRSVFFVTVFRHYRTGKLMHASAYAELGIEPAFWPADKTAALAV